MRLPVLGFGAWRLFLASLVAASHLWEGMILGYAAYAVWGFFVLSGFLMTFVLTNKYGFDGAGLRTYAFNRFMRIFPLYWLAVIGGVATLWYAGRHGIDLRQINPQFYLPAGTLQWLHVATLFPGFSYGGLPVPVSNALAIEVGYYMLLPLMARSRSAASSCSRLSRPRTQSPRRARARPTRRVPSAVLVAAPSATPPSAAATAVRTSPVVRALASSHMIDRVNRGPKVVITRYRSRVFPMPPGPSSVTRRPPDRTSSVIATRSLARPTKLPR